MNSKTLDALDAQGIDLRNVSNSKDNRPIPGQAVYGAIMDMAVQAITASTVTIAEKAGAHAGTLGMTTSCINTLKDFEEAIAKQERDAKRVLENVRSLKSAMTLELQFLEKAVKQINAMDIPKTIDNLERLRTLAESATIKKLFGQ